MFYNYRTFGTIELVKIRFKTILTLCAILISAHICKVDWPNTPKELSL